MQKPRCHMLTQQPHGSTPCTPEEKWALDFFLEKTAPYMAENAGVGLTGTFWLTALPRAFHSVPATRHLITAIGILESCIGVFDPAVLSSRCRQIHHNYSLALVSLRQPNLHPADLAFAPLLAWLLETLTLHDDHAEVHVNALQKLMSSPTFANEHLKNIELSMQELEHLISCVRRTRSIRVKHNVEAPLEQVLAWRSIAYLQITPREMVSAFELFYENFDPPRMTLDQLNEAGGFVHGQTVAVHSNVYRSDVPIVISAALAYLCNLSLAVLPQSPLYSVMDNSTETRNAGLDFILAHFEDIAARTMAKRTDQVLLNDLLSLALRVMKQHTPAEWLVSRSERLAALTMTMYSSQAQEHAIRTANFQNALKWSPTSTFPA